LGCLSLVALPALRARSTSSVAARSAATFLNSHSKGNT
jgi:hypothetical protein